MCVAVVYDNLLQVRSNDITFDEKGVELVVSLYNDIKSSVLEDVNITIGVHVDGAEWFKNEDGNTYNEDAVTLDDFLSNIEY